ncbi:MAG: isocitrate/isopropylmalate dehydrogenase family protein [Canidatus Methanoxibalbensis ujae]|nr:isocitrate/isopropylmalate dehydrogenase family protein [Candidatus Methanoxibalbensis ujae]
MKNEMAKKKVAVIRGDGIGPEVVDAAMRVIEAVGGADYAEFIMCDAGEGWWRSQGCRGDSLIPHDTFEILEESDACLKGPTTTPGGEGSPRSVAVTIRQQFSLFANVRPIKTYKNVSNPLALSDFECLCVREATEGLYFGHELKLSDDVFIAIRKITMSASVKIAEFAFNEAEKRSWDVVVIHKSNILKMTCGIFVKSAYEAQRNHPDVGLEEIHIDNIAQQLIKNPQRFNHKVLLSSNLFMDIISEECSALAGSIGLIPSANIGDNYAMFEPAHGSAPKYAGRDVANPTAMILASAWLLEYLGENEKASKIRNAVEAVISEGRKITYDIGGSAKTSEMTDEIIRKIEESPCE